METLAPHVRAHLHAGSTIEDLREMCGGCTTWVPGGTVEGVCGRLDYLRRRLNT